MVLVVLPAFGTGMSGFPQVRPSFTQPRGAAKLRRPPSSAAATASQQLLQGASTGFASHDGCAQVGTIRLNYLRFTLAEH